MRTTVTLDPDVERLLRDEAHRSRRSFKAVLNQSVRQALTQPRSADLPTLLPGRPLGILPGIDPRRLNEMADELEAEAQAEVLRRSEHTP